MTISITKNRMPQKRPSVETTPLVLVVDHSSRSRAVARQILEEAGCRVITAVNGLHGAHLFREDPAAISVVLVDINLPHMDGIDTFLALRDIKLDARVVLTGHHEESESLDRILSFGFAGFSQKPFEPQALVTKVQQVLAA